MNHLFCFFSSVIVEGSDQTKLFVFRKNTEQNHAVIFSVNLISNVDSRKCIAQVKKFP